MKTDRIEIRIGEELKTRYSEHADQRGLPLGSWLLNAAAEQYDREQTTGLRKLRKIEIADDEYGRDDDGFGTRDMSGLISREFYLVKIDYVIGGGWDHYELRTEPARGNTSNQPRTRGWCGTTNDIAVYAEGRMVVTGQSRTHLHLAELADAAE